MSKLKENREEIVNWTNELEQLQILTEASKTAVALKQRELARMLSRVKILEERIQAGYLEQPRVSDHAIVRYMERVHCIDIKSIKDEILTPEVLEQIETLGPNGKFVSGSLQVVMKNNNVTTIYNPGDGIKRTI